MNKNRYAPQSSQFSRITASDHATIQKGRSWYALLWEGRRVISWLWLLPLLIIIGTFVMTWYIYTQAVKTQLLMEANGIQGTHSQTTTIVLDYASGLRGDLELLMPLLGIFLVAGLIAHEWKSGTLAHLVIRKTLIWFLAVRLTYVLAYLLLLVVSAILISWWMTPHPPSSGDLWLWTWQTVVVIFAPTLFVCSISLLSTHLFTNLIAGYIIPSSLWLGNWLFANAVIQSGGKNNLLLYLLFGWNDHIYTYLPDNWLTGKWLLLVLALILLSCQIPILRNENRFIRNTNE
jgi:hypothetical protein